MDWLLLLILCGFLTAAVICYVRGVYHKAQYPYNTFLFIPEDRFNDYYNMLLVSHNLDPYNEPAGKFRSNYPHFANLFFYPFSFLDGGRKARLLGLSVFLGIPVVCAVCYASKTMDGIPPIRKLIYLVGILGMSYPMLIAVDRANLELYVFVCFAIFGAFYQSGMLSARVATLTAVGAAISLKLYPVLLLVLYVKDRRFKEMFAAALVALCLTLGSGMFLAGGLIKSSLDCVAVIQGVGRLIAEEPLFARANVGLFSCGRLLLTKLHCSDAAAIFTRYYPVIAIVLLIVICSTVLRRSLELWQSVTALVCAMCLVPSISGDYKALLFVVPMLSMAAVEVRHPAQAGICCLFGLLMIPKNFVLFYADVGIASILNPLIILSLCVAVLGLGVVAPQPSEVSRERRGVCG